MEQGLTIEEVDALTGQVVGWPRTGTFRLADMVGIDVLASVARNFPQGVQQGSFSSVLEEIVRRGWVGDKAGQGFYKKTRGADGTEQRFVLDLKTFEYRPLVKAAMPSLEMAKNAATLKERLKLLLGTIPGRTRRRRFCGLCCRICGISPRIASARRRGTPRRSIAPCARDSTGRWVRLRCGMRRGCARPWRALRRWGLAVSRNAGGAAGCGSKRGIRRMAARASSRLRGKREPCRRRRVTRGWPISGTRMGWCDPMRALRWWIWATGSDASNCIR